MGLSRHEAESMLRTFIDERTTGSGTDPDWLPDLELHPNGDEWLAFRPRVLPLQTSPWQESGLPNEGVRLRAGHPPVLFSGALGGLVPLLGLPTSDEKHLGSARLGRYQEYDHGVGTWDSLDPKENDQRFQVINTGHPTLVNGSPERVRITNALVAFLDLRGFTKWSASAPPARVQEAIERVEDAFQQAFPMNDPLFVKGLGDGLMVLSEADPKVTTDAAKAFCRRCGSTVRLARKAFSEPAFNALAVGCAITAGEVQRVYVLGRYDYIGEPVNRASKNQGIAYDELCIADEVGRLLVFDPAAAWHRVADKGWRVSLEQIDAVTNVR
jgi:class 3 adenylate cyclase